MGESAPEPAGEFDDYGGSHDGHCGNCQCHDLAIGAIETGETLNENLEEGRDHDDRENLGKVSRSS